MKKILITGKNSYIGDSFEKWCSRYNGKYLVNSIDMRDNSWKKQNFSGFDVVLHVAGVAHIKEMKENKDLYYEVNRDLAYETAKKAKAEGVKQFIFLSSMSVYGIENGVINENSPLNPKTYYGKSKLEAEGLIKSLEDDDFKISILRPPMVYGKSCRGNYPRLAKFAVKIPIFPDVENKRSMIYIDNLCEFIRLIVDNCSSGLFFPQNNEYVCTSEMVRLIAEAHGRKMIMTKLFNPVLRLFRTGMVSKVLGDLIYEKQMSQYIEEYCIYDFRQSIELTER